MTTNNDTIIAALLIERAGYVRRNLPARIKAVDAALAALGHQRETAALDAAVERAVQPKARRRKP